MVRSAVGWIVAQYGRRRRVVRNDSLICALIVVALVLGSAPLMNATPVRAADQLLSPSGTQGDAAVTAAAGYNAVIRQRSVDVNFDVLPSRASDSSSSKLTLQLFDDVTVTADIDSTARTISGRGRVLTGKVSGGWAYSSVTIVSEDGVMSANIRPNPGTLYQVRYAGRDVHVVRQVDESRFPGNLVSLNVPDSALSRTPAADASQGDATADSNNIIDVLVVYTPAARAQVGGTAAMNSLIDLALSESNTGYANSGVIQRLSIVHRQEVSYTEAGGGVSGLQADLDRLVSTSDLFLNEVHTLRDQHRADFVTLIRTDDPAGQLCGIAAMIFGDNGPQNLTVAIGAPRAFNVTAQGCATGNYTFAHELGHTMGVRHNIEADPTQNEPYTYNHGYCSTTGNPAGFRDIMGVNRTCNNLSLTRLNYWSNPNLIVRGVPGGNATADARQTLNNTLPLTQNFRERAVVTPPPVACAPRPRVDVQAAPTGDGRLRVSVSASGANNSLREIRFGPASNGLVDAPGVSGVPGNVVVPIPDGTVSVQFFVRRAGPGAVTTPFVVWDQCGDWPSFAGGGDAAF